MKKHHSNVAISILDQKRHHCIISGFQMLILTSEDIRVDKMLIFITGTKQRADQCQVHKLTVLAVVTNSIPTVLLLHIFTI